jgi:hypothetical protein
MNGGVGHNGHEDYAPTGTRARLAILERPGRTGFPGSRFTRLSRKAGLESSVNRMLGGLPLEFRHFSQVMFRGCFGQEALIAERCHESSRAASAWLKPHGIRVDFGRVASGTLENVLPRALQLVLLVVILGPAKVGAMCRGLIFNLVVRGRIRRRSATHANFDAGIRGLKPRLKPHGYRQETVPRSFKTSKLQRRAGKPALHGPCCRK